MQAHLGNPIPLFVLLHDDEIKLLNLIPHLRYPNPHPHMLACANT